MITAPISDLNYNVHISEEFKFIFFNNPKAGCSTTKATLNRACAARLGIDLQYREMHDIHVRESNILKTPKQVGIQRFNEMVEDPEIFRFCVLREPFSRLASAYASKFRGNSKQQQRLNLFLGRPVEYAWPDINEFVEVVTSSSELRDYDAHWRLQYRQVCAQDVELRFVGFQEELEPGLRKIGQFLFGDENIEIFDARQRFRQNVSKSSVLLKRLTPASIRRVREAYAEDFDFYRREWARMHPCGTPAPLEAMQEVQ